MGGGHGQDGELLGVFSKYKHAPNIANEMLFDIYISCRCQKTPHL
jgi:hypothetical protein